MTILYPPPKFYQHFTKPVFSGIYPTLHASNLISQAFQSKLQTTVHPLLPKYFSMHVISENSMFAFFFFWCKIYIQWNPHNWSGLLLSFDKFIHLCNVNPYQDIERYSVQFSSVAQSCPTLCDPMNCSMPGLPVHHQLPEFTQTHVHRVSDAIQPSHPLSSPSPPAPNPSQHQSLFQWVNSSHEVAKVLEFQL